jgi:hypothetical protein
MINVSKNIPEIVALIFLVLGFFFAISTFTSKFLAFIIIFLWGCVFGRIWFNLDEDTILPWILITFGFYLGFILASFFLGYGSYILLTIFFYSGMLISYYVHKNEYIKTLNY